MLQTTPSSAASSAAIPGRVSTTGTRRGRVARTTSSSHSGSRSSTSSTSDLLAGPGDGAPGHALVPRGFVERGAAVEQGADPAVALGAA